MATRPVMNEMAPFGGDDTVPDNSQDIMDIFGLSADVGEGNTSTNADDGQGAPAAPASPAPSAAEGGEGQQPTTPPTPQQGDGSSQQPQPPAPAPAAAPAPAPSPAAPTPDPRDAELQSLRAQVQALSQHLTQQQQPQPQAQQPAAQPGQVAGQPQQDPTAELQNYNLAIPADVLQAIRSDDDQMAAAGMQHLINSLGKIVHQRVAQHMDHLVSQRLDEYGHQQNLSQQQQQMQNDYYSNFTDHNDPAIRLIVAQEAQQMWTENPQLAWGDQARNSLGARVNARLGRTAAAPAPQPQPAPTPAPAPAPRPAAMTGATTRPAPAGGSDESSFIRDIMTA